MRNTYKVELTFTITMDDEQLKDVKELMTWRMNEMLSALERKDDVRIVLVHNCDVNEVE